MKGRSAARSRPGRRVPFFLFFAVAQPQSTSRPKIHASCTPVFGGPPHSRNSHGLMTVHHLGMETSQCNAVLRRNTATTTARTRGASLCWTAMWLWVGMPNCFSRPGPNDDHDQKNSTGLITTLIAVPSRWRSTHVSSAVVAPSPAYSQFSCTMPPNVHRFFSPVFDAFGLFLPVTVMCHVL